MSIKHEEIRSLLSFFEKSGWEELRLEADGVLLAVSKNGSLSAPAATAAALAGPAPIAPTGRSASADLPAQTKTDASAQSAAANPVGLAPGQVYLRAPSLGVVWSRPKPGAPSYIEVGQMVEIGTTVCLIEVMKLFTQMDSTVRGKVVRCLVADGEMVEHDTPVFIVEVV